MYGTTVICVSGSRLAKGHAQVVSQKALEAVSERLRDTKKSVRRDAAAQLLAVFRSATSPHPRGVPQSA